MDRASMAAGFHLGSQIPVSDPHHYHPHPHSMPPPLPVPAPALAAPSDDDDESIDAAAAKSKKSSSPWHRVRWTDAMVRLLISLVHCVEDDAAPDPAAGRRPSSALQRKGKWKAVSKLMLGRGCHRVSPQQCEDKFNDLNKRYKRLNEILGRGTTCQVVENPDLLDSMPHVPPKAKDDVRKILTSKHLFYREMCAYHNGPRGTGTSTTASHEVDYHGNAVTNHIDGDSDEDDDDEVGSVGGGRRVCEGFRAEMDAVFGDTSESRADLMDWLGERELQLKEERVAMEAEALKLEKERFRWQTYRYNKDREMERLRLGNERLILENERMSLLVKMKEVEVEHMRYGESMESTGGFHLERGQGRDHMDM